MDLISFILFGLAGGLSTFIIIKVFRWGYETEKKGKRTDIFGRPNNHMKE